MTRLITQSQEVLDRPLTLGARILLLGSALVVVGAIFAPLWQIRMVAPQYEEGLEMTIYAHKLEGGNGGQDIEEINVLNHYIGMQPIDEADFTEMEWIPFALGIFALLSLRAFVFGRIGNAVDVLVLFIYFGAFSFYRFYYRLYTYAHDLDPKAPVDVEPFMPAIVGKNQIANFTQYSYPQSGSLLLGVYVALLVGAIWWSWRSRRADR